ncbi:acyltransferase domain-containing protein [Streptomyces sp. NPDC088789]|uniref:acyltransferase domain-containing protein n=1 Tax=Streptomyces sp. NPDC088789 TaxID=3365899 RepID=UPI0038194442
MLPDAVDLPEVLLDLAVSHEDINEVIARRRELTSDAGAMRLLEECVEELVRDIGEVPVRDPERIEVTRFTELVDEGPQALGRLFPVYVFLAALPFARAYHKERGIPEDVSRRTLADLGRNMAVHRRRYGSAGLHVPFWIRLHFRGELYQTGRLQFERALLGERRASVVAAAGIEAGPETPCLSVHIPDFSGPLSAAACDRSVALAREFFARYFPEEPYAAAVCHSWLLDGQLRQYLPAQANIVRFQERFQLVNTPDSDPSDHAPVQFVFGNPDLEIAGLPRRTALERAVGDHLRDGGHWYTGHGWFAW